MGATHKTPKGKDDLVAKLEADLTTKKLAWSKEQDAQGTARAFSLQVEADYWNKVLARTNLSAKDRAAVETKYLAVHGQIIKERWADEEAGYKTSLDTADKNEQAKLELVRAHTAEVKRFFGDESTEYKRAQEEEVRETRKAQDEINSIERIHRTRENAFHLEQIAEAQRVADFRVQMGAESTEQLLADERRFVDAKYQIEMLANKREQDEAGNDKNYAKKAELVARAEALEQAYQDTLTAIDRKGTLERSQIERTAKDSAVSALSQSLSKMITLQQGFAGAFKSLYGSLLNVVDTMIASFLKKTITKWLTHEAAKTGATVAGTATRTGVEAAGATTSVAISAISAIKQIAHHAAKAAAGAYAAIASIPVVGPFLAPIAAAAALVGVIAIGRSIVSAEGGMDRVGYDGQLISAHKDEMVLSARYANPLRDMLSGGGGWSTPSYSGPAAANNNTQSAANDTPRGGGGDTFIIHAVDVRSFHRLLQDNHSAVGDAVRKNVRNGGKLSTK